MLSPTDKDEIEVNDVLFACWSGTEEPPRNSFDHEALRRFLYTQLGMLKRGAETTRPLQIYLVVNALCRSYECEGLVPLEQSEFVQMGELILQTLRRDFCQRRFHHPHTMAAFSTVQAMRQLGATFSQQDQEYVLDFLQAVLVQPTQPNAGGFRACPEGECEARSTYAACVAAFQVGLFDTDCPLRERALVLFKATPGFLIQRASYAGGFGANSFEPHCAYVYCTLASLRLLSRLFNKDLIEDIPQRTRDDTVFYLVSRHQECGLFNGRPNKHVDGCYTFWVSGALALLKKEALINTDLLHTALTNYCQEPSGGLRDKPGIAPDSFHSCYVISGWRAASGLLTYPELAL